MKPQEQILLLITFWSLNSWGTLQPKLTVAHPHTFLELIAQNYSLKQDDSNNKENCTPNGDCYRDPPKSEDIPHIITPSGGRKISVQHPILRWQPVENIERYTIIVRGLDWEWEEQIEGDRWWTQYTGPELEAGKTYHFIVNANNRHPSSRERFKIVDEETAQSVGEEVTRLQQNIANPEERAIAIAQFYQDQNLPLDAIETLETFIEENPQITIAYCSLAPLYRVIEREDLATQVEEILHERSRSCSLSSSQIESIASEK